MIRKLFLLSLLSTGFVLFACGRVSQVAQVNIDQANLYPEGVVYDGPRSRFLVSSLRNGDIGQALDDGSYTVAISDARLISTIGLHIDTKRNRLIACVSDPGVSVRTAPATQKKLAGVAVYSLVDNSLLHFVNLAEGDPGEHFANDAVNDADGNIYVTNSFSPVIYKIGADYQASELLRDDRFTGQGFNLNGIELIGDALIVAKYNEGLLFRVPLANPAAFEQISIPQTFAGADGLLRIDDKNIVLIANIGAGKDQVVRLTSNDGWKSANVAGVVEKAWEFPTTADLRGGEVYVLNARLNRLFGGAGDTPRFEIFNISR